MLNIACLQDPDYLLNLPQLPQIVLEKSSSSGGKFWLAIPINTGLSLRWGKRNANGTVKHISQGSCLQQNKILELKERVMEKLRDGYTIIQHETLLP